MANETQTHKIEMLKPAVLLTVILAALASMFVAFQIDARTNELHSEVLPLVFSVLAIFAFSLLLPAVMCLFTAHDNPETDESKLFKDVTSSAIAAIFVAVSGTKVLSLISGDFVFHSTVFFIGGTAIMVTWLVMTVVEKLLKKRIATQASVISTVSNAALLQHTL